ncbi:MAG TPA: hemerythrin domain-containing protein [Nitrosopumilus sp.]|jgi:hemerythrin-like domain-containing protein|nr:cation-binding protein [Nitrososphaerota archaeon]MDP6327081.1 hemerythrin domain-containing protein [Nitrosopumilus sp.]HJM25379.1 hemerythrin domain-containing protein [Nitrosopumilus sp.]HJO31387.1 hemerythrin domain-containing protein [Nitrosopumilus sp.]|tara:strand:+ start:263 stop:820 length:558 start_codon:yes stop_codon:yes gene_type:complete
MSTASLRRDHDLIEKVIKSMETTIQLLTNGKQIPESILLPVIDFTKNFTDVCHHSKEEKSLFPALEQAGLPSNMGPVAMMLMDHQRSREIGTEMEESAKKYLSSGDSTKLISDMHLYVEHITEHLWKENNKLFMMAEARLQYVSEKVDKELNEIEELKLKDLGKSREHYEELAENLSKNVSQQTI